MAGASIDKKINKAYKLVGKKLGWPFKVFRPDTWVTPLQDRNYIFSRNLAFSQDTGFSKNPNDTLAYFQLYSDYSDLQAGDIIYSLELGKTFTIFEKTELRGPIGVQTDDRIDVLRPIYTPNADKKTAFEAVATNVPVALEGIGAVQDAGALSGTSSKMSAGQTRIELWSWLPVGLVLLNDVIEWQGVRYLVQEVWATNIGTKLRGISMKTGK